MPSSYMHELEGRGSGADGTEGVEVALRSKLTTRSRELEGVEEAWSSELTLLFIVTQAPHSSTSGLKTVSQTRMGGTNIYARSPGIQILAFKLVGIDTPGVMMS